jgi:hypothetical protein
VAFSTDPDSLLLLNHWDNHTHLIVPAQLLKKVQILQKSFFSLCYSIVNYMIRQPNSIDNNQNGFHNLFDLLRDV